MVLWSIDILNGSVEETLTTQSLQKITNTRGEMVMTRVTRVAYITVGVGDLKITNTSDGNGELILKWFSVRDFQRAIGI